MKYKPRHRNGPPPLTEREQLLLRLEAEGKSRAEIAEALGITQRSVSSYRAVVHAKARDLRLHEAGT